MKRAAMDDFYSQTSYKRAMSKFLIGDTFSRAVALEDTLNSAWVKGDNSKRLLDAISSLKQYLSKNDERLCDLGLYDHFLSIMRLSDKYFERRSTRDRVVRMLVFRIHDRFTTSCVHKLQSDIKKFYNEQLGEQLIMLSGFRHFLASESPDLVQGGGYPDNCPSMMNKLNLVSNGDRAWYEFMMNAALKVADEDHDRAVKIRRMPRKERMAAEFEFVVDHSCVLLSQNNRFMRFVDEVSSLDGKLVFELTDNEAVKSGYESLERYVAMYKICMRLRAFDKKELMEKVELHTRKNPV